MSKVDLPFSSLAHKLLTDLAADHCVAVTGLSNTGKSTLMRALASPEAEAIYRSMGDRSACMIYVDCNRAVANSAQAFYEIVLRSALERLTDHAPSELASTIRSYYQSVTESESAFSASLSFNLAFTELCEQLGDNICLLLDEFDEIYTSLDERALLNLRALRDRFGSQLVFATATVRRLPALRGRAFADEFAEMFSHSTYPLPLLDDDEALDLLHSLELPSLTKASEKICIRLAGGHPGLLIATAQVLSELTKDQKGDEEAVVFSEPQPRAECLKIWSQLTNEEQNSLITLTLNPQAGLPKRQMEHFGWLSLLRQGSLFSPIFADFLNRKAHGPEVKTQGVYLDLDSGDVWVDGIRIPVLTDLEFRLLALLYDRRDKLTDKYHIVTSVWGEEYLGEVDDARVEKLVSRLRSKIESDPANPRYLITRRGRGYKLLSVPRAN
ncbi:MAG: winged helix-turn-helix transcriptional regulator [Anaerolineaceae bacterium]|nr:MAG: winged helix-turn-helix transcriptional regulator [Anaerolineaceae bacterium]